MNWIYHILGIIVLFIFISIIRGIGVYQFLINPAVIISELIAVIFLWIVIWIVWIVGSTIYDKVKSK